MLFSADSPLTLRFPAPTPVEGRSSITDLYKPGHRCGIYVLLFDSGEAYVGQSVNVVRRFAEHLRVHRDIVSISFQEVPAEDLDTVEEELIRGLERCGKKLRNVAFSALPPVDSDFDLVMPLEQQNVWLSDLDLIDDEGPRIINGDLRRKYNSRYRRLAAINGVDALINLVRSYVQNGIPAIKRGEVAFWSLSCLPWYSDSDITVLLRLNVFWQEVLTVFREKQTGADFFSLHLAEEPIKADRGIHHVPGIEFCDHRYTPGGHDQIQMVVPSASFVALMARRSVRRAIRAFNHRLMKKGACNFGRHHCLDLADHMVDG